MFDIIQTLRGRKYCGWCNYHDTWFDAQMNKYKWVQRLVMWEDKHLPMWKFAEHLHWRLHDSGD